MIKSALLVISKIFFIDSNQLFQFSPSQIIAAWGKQIGSYEEHWTSDIKSWLRGWLTQFTKKCGCFVVTVASVWRRNFLYESLWAFWCDTQTSPEQIANTTCTKESVCVCVCMW